MAKRLEQLGALTQGDRNASSAAEAMSVYNLQNQWAARLLPPARLRAACAPARLLPLLLLLLLLLLPRLLLLLLGPT